METEDFYKQTTLPDLHAKESHHPPLPKKIGPYKIESLLNKGGMSFLYLALSETGEPIAVKVLVPKYFKHKEMAARFLKEAQIIGMSNHPNIVKLYGQGQWEQGLYIAMELVRGVSLRQFIQQKSLSLKRALEIVIQVGYALCHLHAHGVIHRDLKPENILITESGEIKVIDFGIAQLKEEKEAAPQQHLLMGTPVYMSPEQKENPENVSFASDIYSLGVIAYELILGRLSHGTIHLSLLSKKLQEILGKALKSDPKERYLDVVDFITEISAYLKSIQEEKPEAELSNTTLEMVEEGRSLLIPLKPPRWPPVEIGLAVHPGEISLSGLYLDFFRLSESRLICSIAEPMRNSSLLHLSIFRGMLRTAIALSKEQHPVQMLNALNESLSHDPMRQQFSLCFLLLNAEKNQLSFISCNSSQLLHIPEGSAKLRSLSTPNPALGTTDSSSLLETVDNWNSGDTLFFHSREIPPLKSSKELLLLSPQHQAEALLAHGSHQRPTAALSIHRLL